MTAIAYYISSHGFGHAARQGAVMAALSARGIAVHVRTLAPQKFFLTAASYHPQRYDVGMIQHDALTFDVPATLQNLDTLAQQENDLIQQEIAFIKAKNCQLVVSDMPPLACAIADQAGIPSIVNSHFLWDWVYAHYVEDYPAFSVHIERMQAQYRLATLALQMKVPFPHDFPLFERVDPVGLVYNPPTRTRATMRREFAIPDDKALVLLSMGGHQWGQSDITVLQEVEDAIFLVMPSAWAQVKHTPEHFRKVPTAYAHYHDLIAAADLVVGKAGGSTVAEVIGHRTPMIYTVGINDWREAALLKQTMERYASAMYVPREDFIAGAWVQHLPRMLARNHHWAAVNRAGVGEVVQAISAFL